MQNKHPGKSIDGFFPRTTAPRIIGVAPPSKTTEPARPQIGTFTGVGVTMPSYMHRRLDGDTKPLDMALTAGKPKRFRRLRRFRPKFTWKRAVLAVVIIGAGIGLWLGSSFLYNIAKVLHGNPLSIFSTTKLKGEDSGRVNILLAGNSSDDAGHQGADLTDSIMLISIDTKNNQAFMMSLPRDLYVNIPGNGYGKINEAYVDGESQNFNEAGFAQGGMGLLEKVVSQNLGINVNYYALVDYNAFRDAVNAVGGIDINIQSTDPRGLYDPNTDYVTHSVLVKLSNGVQHLNGEQALDLARARGDSASSYGFPLSDFDRTTHQRQELVALKTKATSSGVLANPIKLTQLMNAVGTNVKTDFSPSEVHRLYDISKNISSGQIQSVSLNNVNGNDLLANYTTNSGESALIPAAGLDDYSAIQAYLKKLMSNNPIVKEGATIVVLNGTDTSGLAAKASLALTTKGLTVSGTGDASALQPTSLVIDNSAGKKPASLQLLESIYGKSVTTTNPYAQQYTADFIVVLGKDQVTTQ